MTRVYPNLYVGGDPDVPGARAMEMKILHCAKSPWHQWAVGYRGNLSPCHPDYLFKVTPHFEELALNLVDAPFEPPPLLVDAALVYLDSWLVLKKDVLVHCNMGLSRAPTIAFLWLATRRKWDLEQFMQAYPDYAPGIGMCKLIERRLGFVPSMA